jgi:hypothetical protein
MGLESALTQSLREARAAGTRLARIVYPIDLTDPWSLLSKLCVPSHLGPHPNPETVPLSLSRSAQRSSFAPRVKNGFKRLKTGGQTFGPL